MSGLIRLVLLGAVSAVVGGAFVVVKNRQHSLGAFAEEAEYLFHQDPSLDLGHGTLECTKRGMGLTAYCAFRVLGTAWFGAHVDRLLEKAARFAEEIERQADYELACPPQTNIVCFRYVGEGDAKLGDLDELQRRVRLGVLASGRYYLVEAQHRGVRWLRVTLMNPRTDEEDLRGLLELTEAPRGLHRTVHLCLSRNLPGELHEIRLLEEA